MPSRAAEIFARANELEDAGRLEEAVEQYRILAATLEEVEDKVTVILAQIGCLNILGRTKEARSLLPLAAQLLPAESENHPHLEFAKAGVLAAEGKRKHALKILDRLVSDKEGLLKATNGLDLYQHIQMRRVFLLIELRRDKDARPILEEVLTFRAENVSVHFYAGLCYFGLRDSGLAKKHYEEALSKGLPPLWEWQARVHLGPIYYADEALAKAKLEYERAEALGAEIGASAKDQRNVYLWLAKICRELGQEKEAAKYEVLSRQT